MRLWRIENELTFKKPGKSFAIDVRRVVCRYSPELGKITKGEKKHEKTVHHPR